MDVIKNLRHTLRELEEHIGPLHTAHIHAAICWMESRAEADAKNKFHAAMREWIIQRNIQRSKWEGAARMRIHREAVQNGHRGGCPAIDYISKDRAAKIQRVYSYLQKRAVREFLARNPEPKFQDFIDLVTK